MMIPALAPSRLALVITSLLYSAKPKLMIPNTNNRRMGRTRANSIMAAPSSLRSFMTFPLLDLTYGNRVIGRRLRLFKRPAPSFDRCRGCPAVEAIDGFQVLLCRGI